MRRAVPQDAGCLPWFWGPGATAGPSRTAAPVPCAAGAPGPAPGGGAPRGGSVQVWGLIAAVRRLPHQPSHRLKIAQRESPDLPAAVAGGPGASLSVGRVACPRRTPDPNPNPPWDSWPLWGVPTSCPFPVAWGRHRRGKPMAPAAGGARTPTKGPRAVHPCTSRGSHSAHQAPARCGAGAVRQTSPRRARAPLPTHTMAKHNPKLDARM